MPDLHDDFRAAAEEYTQRLRDERERRENPRKNTAENADAFAEHAEALLAQQSNNNII